MLFTGSVTVHVPPAPPRAGLPTAALGKGGGGRGGPGGGESKVCQRTNSPANLRDQSVLMPWTLKTEVKYL